ncbi:MAG: hypothetical protein R3C40_12230 [Parvularculaceae bacterium]
METPFLQQQPKHALHDFDRGLVGYGTIGNALFAALRAGSEVLGEFVEADFARRTRVINRPKFALIVAKKVRRHRTSAGSTTGKPKRKSRARALTDRPIAPARDKPALQHRLPGSDEQRSLSTSTSRSTSSRER